MSSGSSAASSQQSIAKEAQEPIEIRDSSSSPNENPILSPTYPVPTISSRTRSKAKVINPEKAQTITKTKLFSHKVRNTRPVALNMTSSDEKEAKEQNMSLGSLFCSIYGETPSASEKHPAHDTENQSAKESLSHNGDSEDELQEYPATEFACENLDSSMNAARVKSLLRNCYTGCRLVIPEPGERCHRFDNFEMDQAEPAVVLSAQFFKVRLSLPLHPFIQDILEFYDIAPLQLTINSYRMAMCVYVLYNRDFNKQLSAFELGYFYQLKQTGKSPGIFYLAAWGVHDGKCIKGNKQRMTGWLEQFLYCYDYQPLRKTFNVSPSKHISLGLLPFLG